jgi:small GTP-binding protein
MIEHKLSEEYDMMFKVLLLGDSGVGKSSLLLRYTKNQFSTDMRATIGVEFGIKYLELDNFQIKVQIWDTAGMERYRAMTSAYYKGAKGVIVVYDICRKITFDNLDKWIDDFRSKADQDAVILIVGNKSDSKDKREVNSEEGKTKAEKNNTAFMETSAKSSENVQKAFFELCKEILKNYKEKNSDMINDIEENKKKNNGKFNKNRSKSITGVAGGYNIEIDITHDENIENEEFEKKSCC